MKKLKDKFFTELKEDYPQAELELIFNLLIDNYLDLNLSCDNQESVVLANPQLDKFDEALSRLIKNEPILYILGEVEFFGRTFKVNSHVHVPRPETLTMVK